MPRYTTPGIPPSVHTVLVWCTLLDSVVRGQLTKPWAQEENIPWVEGGVRVKVLKGVMRERPVCAELLRSSRE